MHETSYGRTVFVTMVRSPGQRRGAGVLLDSIRAFGGALSDCPVRLFEANRTAAPCSSLAAAGAEVVPLELPDDVRDYPFADKVFAAAAAEETAGPEVDTLVMLSPECLVTRPPLLFALAEGVDAALRPVHIRNIGLAAGDPVDGFWRGVYNALGVEDLAGTIESFVDRQTIRPYYNSAAYSIRPSCGILREWRRRFRDLVADEDFQSGWCADARHRIFLHQAVLSALLATALDRERVRMLPPEYGYPYNLHESAAEDRRARSLNDLVCAIYEERSIDPAEMDDIEVREPLASWLSKRAAGRPEAR